jgi:Fe-only nitrogenase accessory protein AnfO
MKIAAYVNGANHITNFYEEGKVVLFDNDTGSWSIDKEETIELAIDMGVAMVRSKLKKMAKNLDGCSIFVAGATRGVPYAILEGMGFNIWKSSGDVTQYLDYIEEKEQEEKERKNKPPVEPMVIGDIGACQASCRLLLYLCSNFSAQSPHDLRRVIGGPFSAMSKLC